MAQELIKLKFSYGPDSVVAPVREQGKVYFWKLSFRSKPLEASPSFSVRIPGGVAPGIAESDMTPSISTNGWYTYVHDVKEGQPEAIDVHHIIAARRGAGGLMFCTYSPVFAITCFLVLLLFQDKPLPSVLWSFSLAGFLLRQFLRKCVQKESVIILPAFGVQLETVYTSGKTVRHFVPIGRMLKPVLNECVTPVTCYWSLSLILRGEEELLLVFKELYPPVTMLVPIWKALCAAIDDNCNETHTYCDTK